MKLSNNKILITGGASGIGKGLAERFLKENNTVIICGRREDTLKAAAAQYPGLLTKKCDLEIAAQREELFSWISKEHPEIIPPAMNTDLGGKGIHDEFPPVSAFIESIFTQLAQGRDELTFGFSEAMTKAGPDQLRQAFTRMNP